MDWKGWDKNWRRKNIEIRRLTFERFYSIITTIGFDYLTDIASDKIRTCSFTIWLGIEKHDQNGIRGNGFYLDHVFQCK